MCIITENKKSKIYNVYNGLNYFSVPGVNIVENTLTVNGKPLKKQYFRCLYNFFIKGFNEEKSLQRLNRIIKKLGGRTF